MTIIGFLLLLIPCIVFVVMGIPFVMGVVPPNPIYGFRIKRTLQDAEVWYPANRVAGLWSIWTGIAAAATSIATLVLGLPLATAALIELLPFIVGIAGMFAHVFRVIHQIIVHKQKTTSPITAGTTEGASRDGAAGLPSARSVPPDRARV